MENTIDDAKEEIAKAEETLEEVKEEASEEVTE